MNVAFYTVIRRDPQHFLHAQALVESVRRVMPGVTVLHLTDTDSPAVLNTHAMRLPDGPMLERRLEHYAACSGATLFLDTDTSVTRDVRDVFDDPHFDIAIADRHWAGIPQGDAVMHTMPFNTGVVFSRSPEFWQETLRVWRGFPKEQKDWMSEQRAVYQVIRTGRFRVKILPGEVYDYPPRTQDDPCTGAAIVHYKGPERKRWLTEQIQKSWHTASV